MVDVVVHVGLPRTGTTFLQHNVFPYIDNVNFIGKNFLFKPLEVDKLNIISNEDISWRYRFDMVYRLKDMFPDAKIICVKREFDSWIDSAYSQYCEAVDRDFKTFDDWCVEYIANEIWFDDYFDLLNSSFDEVLYIDYEVLLDDRDVFLKCICDFIGVDVPSYINESLNKSLNGNCLRLINYIKKKNVSYTFKRLVVKGLKFINR